MKIEPGELNNEEEFMKEVMRWRGVSHEYVDPKTFKDAEGKNIQTLFCNKCGMSSSWFIHDAPYGRNISKNETNKLP